MRHKNTRAEYKQSARVSFILFYLIAILGILRVLRILIGTRGHTGSVCILLFHRGAVLLLFVLGILRVLSIFRIHIFSPHFCSYYELR